MPVFLKQKTKLLFIHLTFAIVKTVFFSAPETHFTAITVGLWQIEAKNNFSERHRFSLLKEDLSSKQSLQQQNLLKKKNLASDSQQLEDWLTRGGKHICIPSTKWHQDPGATCVSRAAKRKAVLSHLDIKGPVFDELFGFAPPPNWAHVRKQNHGFVRSSARLLRHQRAFVHRRRLTLPHSN